jgi:photosystem II PsbU protein
MKRLARLLTVLCLVIGCLGWLSVPQGAIAAELGRFTLPTPMLLAEESPTQNLVDQKLTTEFGKKIDLNNTNVRRFRAYRGMYPSLARKVVENAPYDKVEDVLSIPGLSATQKELLQANLDKFTVTPPTQDLNQGDDRINNGVY